MKWPPVGTSVRVEWTDASFDGQGWNYDMDTFMDRIPSRHFNEGVYTGQVDGCAVVVPAYVLNDEGEIVVVGSPWWIPVGCVKKVETAEFKEFRGRKRARK